MSTELRHHTRSGQLLIEMLLAIAAAAVVVALGTQLAYVGFRTGKTGSEKNVALGLTQELFEGARSAATESWLNIYALSHGSSTQYYAQATSGKWAIATGTQNVTVNSIAYTRSFTVQHVCRNFATDAITGITDSDGGANSTSSNVCTTAGSGVVDPSTQKISVTVSWPNADAVASAEYVTRWRNKSCLQTSWTATSSNATSCPATVFESSSNLSATGTITICSGGC